MQLRMRAATTILLLVAPCPAARLTFPAQQAFENYAAALEKRLAQQHARPDTYLAVLNLGAADRIAAERQLRSGTVRVEPVDGGTREVSGGLLHHRRGTDFVSGGKAEDILALLRDYRSMQAASPESHSAIRTIYVKAEGAETLAAARARNLLVSTKCYTITALEDQADAILSISSEKQGASSIFTHIPFTGQKIYTSATLFDRRTGEVLWTTDRSDIWFGSPARAGERIVQRLKKDRQCK